MRLSFTESPLDHAGLKRSDPDWVEARKREPGARALLFHAGDLLTHPDGSPLTPPPEAAEAAGLDASGLIFLGLDPEGAWFAGALAEAPETPPRHFRATAMRLDPDLSCIVGRARALLAWHARRRFCSNCGTPLTVRDGGSRRTCERCGMEHFPRVDPSVIMLPYAGERCVLGRQAAWPPGMYATLAGFMEPGETIEEACAREVAEEIGRPVVRAVYVGSQPWPFPSSLMIGLMAEIEPGDLAPDDDLEDARWFTREEARALYEGELARIAPAHFSISRVLIDRWVRGEG